MRLWMILLLAVGPACGGTAQKAESPAERPAAEATATAYTTRLPAADPETQAIVLAQTVYGATREENSPGAIILCPQTPALAFTAMNRITHMPVNAPLLYMTPQGDVSEATLREMERLKPEGVSQDGKVQVYVIGDPEEKTSDKVRERLKYTVRRFGTVNAITLSDMLDRWAAAMKADHPDEVVVSAFDHPEGIAHGMGAMGWNAHMGKGFAWVYTNSIPEETRKILDRRYGRDGAYIYLTGGAEVISHTVAEELSRYGLVRRIAGPDVYATNAVNAGYKDFGSNFGWWWGWMARDFGWGLSQAGHNFIIASSEDLLGAIPSALLGHMGKHGPILLVGRDDVPPPVSDYLEMVRPFVSGPSHTIRNHAWIVGDESRISWEAQKTIHRLLTPNGLNTAGIAGM